MTVNTTGFDDVRFPISTTLGAAGGEEMQSNVQVTGAGYEYRQPDWADVRGRWDVTQRIKTIEDAALLTAFFRARKGQTVSFRWQPVDLEDRTALNSFFGTGDGGRVTFPLYKVYDDELAPQVRRVVLPVDENVYFTETPFAVYADGILISSGDYSIDFRNGRVTFDTPPDVGATLSWSGEFDVPARFGMPQLRKTFVTDEIISFEEVSIIEILPEEILTDPDIPGAIHEKEITVALTTGIEMLAHLSSDPEFFEGITL